MSLKQTFRATGAALMLLAGAAANAASVSYYLDQSNDLANDVNYVQVTISDGVAGNIDFTVEVLTDAFPTPLSNFGMQAFFFNYDQALNVDMANIVDVDPASWDIREDKNAGGGFGKFHFEAKGTGSTRTELLTFSISGVEGDTVDDYAIGNADDNDGMNEFFAAHVAGYADSQTGNTSGKFAGSTLVPIPAAVWLFGSALGMMGWMRRHS